jgi:3-dehydroquinate synthase
MALRMTAESLNVPLGARSYPIYIGQGTIGVLPEVLHTLGARGAAGLVTDTNVGPLYARAVSDMLRDGGLEPQICVMPAGEQHKRLAQIETLCGEFLNAGLDRSSIVIALGGGVVGDVAAFAASSYMRGVRYVQIPTTVVAQVDSSIGGKTGVNHPLAKNIIGAFHQPSAVVIDLNFLATLPDRELRAGLAEVIKHGIIADADLFAYMEQTTAQILAKKLATLEYPVRRSCEIKASIVAADEREHGPRAALNYGHTFGHGIEAASGYKRFLHGEAVALGMQAAAMLAREVGLVDDGFVGRQKACLASYELPVRWPDAPVDSILSAMQHDKKARAGRLTFIVASAIGRVERRSDIPIESVRRALESLRAE